MTTAAHAVEASGIGRYMRESLWAFPIVEAVHIAALALVVGSIVVLDLRLLGLSRRIPVSSLASHVLPWTLGAFLVAATSGLAMFTAHAMDYLTNGVFMLKMGLILAAGVNAGLLHVGAMRAAAAWDVASGIPGRVRVAAGLSIVLWLSVIACGRLLAYT
ncbi:hypothetical protein BURK1_01014 [Burkholderiales bacterium]|nr:hypothetical protein BURK1_01014 [Burkholderiales bacterium]